MLHRYYQDELHYLHELGREFAAAHPDSAGFLAESGTDPDVERLLEGVAYLTGRLRMKLDDAMPEMTQALVAGLWPQLLRPVPSMTVLRFSALAQARRQVVEVPRGTPVESRLVDGRRCTFTTAYACTVPPFTIETVELTRQAPAALRLRFAVVENADPAAFDLDVLRLHLAGDATVARALRLCLLGCARDAVIEDTHGGRVVLGRTALRAVGYADDEALFPAVDSTFAGYRLIQEYFCYGDKFHFVDLCLGGALAGLEAVDGFVIHVPLDQVPADLPAVGTQHLALGCTPALNVFRRDADPIAIDFKRMEYRVHPHHDPEAAFEIHAVTGVSATVPGRHEAVPFAPFVEAGHRRDDEACYYQEQRRPSVAGDGSEAFLAFAPAKSLIGQKLTASIEAWCSNGADAVRLGVGDVCQAAPDTPVNVSFENLTRPSARLLPPLGTDLHWRYAAHLNLHYATLADLAHLRSLLDIYDLPALVDARHRQRHERQLQALEQLISEPVTVHWRGGPVRGVRTRLVADEQAFSGEGGLYLFGDVLDRCFALAVSLNAVSEFVLEARHHGTQWRFPPRSGEQVLL